VGPARIIAESLAPKPGIREQNLLIADTGRLKAERPVSFHGLLMCCSARENGRHSEKKPHGRCRGKGCAQEQQQIGAPGRLRLCGLGGRSSSLTSFGSTSCTTFASMDNSSQVAQLVQAMAGFGG
jgi:hypothetical protein